MSESELYMQDSNESYDLPRWQTQVDPLSSSAQPSNAAQSPYIYPGPPPQSSSQRIQPVYQGTVPPTKQPRISQLVEQEQQFGTSLSPYSSGGQSQLSRSTSLGASAGNTFAATRLRRHHPQDDLEGALNSDNHAMVGSRQQQPLSHNYFYSPSVGYQPQSLSGGGSNASNEAYTDIYYNGSSSNPPKRLQPGLQESNANRGGRSPLRVPNTPISASPHDYSQQPQYSPTTPSYSYGVDQRTHPPPFQTHNRSHSQVKAENATTPSATSFSSQPSNSAYNASNYSTPYAMETSSPHPSMQSHLSTHPIAMKPSMSTPSTPLSFGAGSATMSPNSNLASAYYPHDQAMVLDSPQKQRRPVGFRHVRSAHDLLPKLDTPVVGRRMAQDGTYLSVGFVTFRLLLRTHPNALLSLCDN